MTAHLLKAVTRTQGNNAALKSGEVPVEGFELEFQEVPVLNHAFRRMVRGLEFDICEMALTTYLCAKEHGVRFTALPIFLVRAFHHAAIVYYRKGKLRDPTALEGTYVGVNRGYTVTTGVWARSILQDEYGVDLSKITWVLSGDEHVESYLPPKNVIPMEPGQTLEGLLVNGNLAAAIGLSTDNEDIVPMIPDPINAGLTAFETRGHYPINHLIVVRDDVLETHPQLAGSLFNSFTESKARYLKQLSDGTVKSGSTTDPLYRQLLLKGFDPLPYGLAANERVLDELVGHAEKQRILSSPPNLKSLFAPSTLALSG